MRTRAKKAQSQEKPLREDTRITWRPTEEDLAILAAAQRKLGIKQPNVIRLALRRLAEHEGLKSA